MSREDLPDVELSETRTQQLYMTGGAAPFLLYSIY